MKKEWIINQNNKNDTLPLVERLLSARGIIKPEEIKEFLNPLETKLTHPNAFADVPKAVDRISKAIDSAETILVYGDFDADGVTSTALLLRTLRHLDAKVEYFIPDRETHGHGLNSKALVKLMTTVKPKVVITVDCASSDIEQVAFLNSFKIDVIITDHHEAPEELPQAYAIINPKAQNALDEKLSAVEIGHLTSLAGVGVAFKLAQALLEHYQKLDFVYEILPYVTVGTISDVVPLIGENRYFVSKGLQLISSGRHHGLKRLLEEAGYNLEQGITSEQIAFGVAPRINASGRLDTVEAALSVLASDNKQEIEMSIITLNNFNKIRQDLCEEIFLQAEEMYLKEQNKGDAIILFNPSWHIGIIGIVASRLVEKYYKPTFLMTYSEETKQIRCSSRSVEGVNIYDVLSANAELFDGFGGHAMAGGLSFDVEKVSFEDVKSALNKTIKEILSGKELVPLLKVDLELNPKDVDINLISDIERLQPFGAANPSPVFVLKDLTLVQKQLIGANKNHLKLIVEDSKHNNFVCLWWSKGDLSLVSGDGLDIAFCPQLNTFNGETIVQLIIQDIHSESLKEDDQQKSFAESDIKIYDHRKKTDIYASVNNYVSTSELKVAVFAEDREIIALLKPYKALSENIFGRQNIAQTDALMFFDYPASPDIFDEIMKKSGAKFIHFMSYEAKKMDEKELLKLFSGMLKFAHNNKDGMFDLEKGASFLAQPESVIIALLQLFEESEMIRILEKDERVYRIEFISNVEIAKTLHSPGYKELMLLIEDALEYKSSFMDCELANLM